MTGRRGGDLVRDDVTRLQIDTAGNVDRSERQFEPSRKTEEMIEKKNRRAWSTERKAASCSRWIPFDRPQFFFSPEKNKVYVTRKLEVGEANRAVGSREWCAPRDSDLFLASLVMQRGGKEPDNNVQGISIPFLFVACKLDANRSRCLSPLQCLSRLYSQCVYVCLISLSQQAYIGEWRGMYGVKCRCT
jgi:hypothetical protein